MGAGLSPSMEPGTTDGRRDRILVVDDERSFAEALAEALRDSGFDATIAGDGAEGLRLAQGHDLLIVDVMMPVLNGYEMVRRLRAAGVDTPVLFLTAKSDLPSVVRALELGGDDHMAKPFRLAELVARVRALLRRAKHSSGCLRFADLEADAIRRRVDRGGTPVDLSRTEFDLLCAFLSNPGQTLSKARLLREVWQIDDPAAENLVEVYVNHLRAKLEARGRPRLIHTVRGKGYVLSLEAPKP